MLVLCIQVYIVGVTTSSNYINSFSHPRSIPSSCFLTDTRVAESFALGTRTPNPEPWTVTLNPNAKSWCWILTLTLNLNPNLTYINSLSHPRSIPSSSLSADTRVTESFALGTGFEGAPRSLWWVRVRVSVSVRASVRVRVRDPRPSNYLTLPKFWTRFV